MTRHDSTPLEFPCRFPIKIMGSNDGSFEDHATSLVTAHTGPLSADDVERRSSRNGRYLAVTVTVHAESQSQLDAIYRDLSASERVLMAL